MTRFMHWLLPLTLLVACQPPAAELSDDDLAALRQVTERFVQTALAPDWDAWSELLTDDAVFLQPNGPALEGRAAIRAWVERFTGMASFTANPIEIEGRNGLAYARGTYAFAMGPDAAMQGADSGKWLTVYRKQADGSWRIFRHIWNSDEPLPQ